MPKYRINIEDGKVTSWVKVLKSTHLNDYLLIQKYKTFAHITASTKKITAYLCIASDQVEAISKANDILKY